MRGRFTLMFLRIVGILAILVGAGASSCATPPFPPPVPMPIDLAGEWRVCLTRAEGQDVCGLLQIDTLLRPSSFGGHHRLRYAIPLATISGDFPLSDSIGTGVARSMQPQGSWQIQIPLDSLYLLAWDDGSIMAEIRDSAGGWVGEWSRTCYAGCREGGKVLLSPVPRKALEPRSSQ